MHSLRLYLLAFSSALLFAVGLPNEYYLMGFPPLGFIALVPLYLALLDVRGWSRAALLTGLYGALHHAISSYWLYFFEDFALWTIGFTTLAYFVIYASFGLCLVYLLRRSGALRPLAFALLWVSFEFLKSTGFLAYPWGLLPFTQSEFLPFLQISDSTGIYGITFLLAFFSASLGEFLFRPLAQEIFGLRAGGLLPSARPSTWKEAASPPVNRKIPIAEPLNRSLTLRLGGFALTLCLLALGYGLWRLSSPLPQRGALRTLIIQQNLNPWSEGTEAALQANTALMKEALAGPVERPELVLFSESSLGYPYKSSRSWYETHPKGDPFLPYFLKQGIWLFTGSPIVLNWDNFSATNSVILIDPRGRVADDYAKMHPVPFAEAIPFFEFAWFRDFLKKAVGLEAGWTMGTRYTIFKLPSTIGEISFGAPICFEDAFAPLCRRFVRDGAELLVNLTDDSWSRRKSAEYQHLAAARFRSIETRRSLVRSTNSGISAVIGPYGEIRDILPPFVAAERSVEVPIVSTVDTLYLELGEWFALLCLFASGLWIFILAGKEAWSRRRR